MPYQCTPDYFRYRNQLWAATSGPAYHRQTVAWLHIAPNGRETVMLGNIIGGNGDNLHVMAHGILFDVPRRVAKVAYMPDAYQYARHLLTQDGEWVAVRERAMVAIMDGFGVTSSRALGIVTAARQRWG